MFVLKSDMTIFCDVDDTLIGWEQPNANDEVIIINQNGRDYSLSVIRENITALQRHKSRGHKIVVWSAGGYEWAETAVKALKIEDIVDAVMCKPRWIYDDLEAVSWMPKAKFGSNDPGHQE